MNATFSKLKKTGEWGVRIKDCDFDTIKPGDRIEVTRKDGSITTVTIKEIVARFDDAIYCSIQSKHNSEQKPAQNTVQKQKPRKPSPEELDFYCIWWEESQYEEREMEMCKECGKEEAVYGGLCERCEKALFGI